MEFPELGAHCSHSSCNMLDDSTLRNPVLNSQHQELNSVSENPTTIHHVKVVNFLPMKCDACNQIFCKDHIQYVQHNCKDAHKKDVQVPVCPLCNQPVPVKRGQLPDIVVGEHIDRYCQSDPALSKRKIYTNKCSQKGCKQKEMVRILCEKCCRNYCLKHRLPIDHHCEKYVAVSEHKPTVSLPNRSSIEKKLQEEEDYMLAKALSASERETTVTRRINQQEKNNCRIC